MKRSISLLLCLCLLTVLTVSAAAADFTPSVSQSAPTATAVITDANGNQTEAPAEELTVTTSTESVDLSSVSVANAVVGDVYEIAATGTVAEALANGSTVTVTFSVSGSTDNLVAVLQKVDGVWVSVPYTIIDIGDVAVPLSGLGPIAFVYGSETTGSGTAATTGTSASGTTPTSPKTGESIPGGIVAASAAIALLAAGTVVLYKKKVA